MLKDIAYGLPKCKTKLDNIVKDVALYLIG